MTDRELDELLDTWNAPAPPESLRAIVRGEFVASRPAVFRPRWTTFAMVVLGVTLFLLVVVEAFPQTLRFIAQIPYTVTSESIRYAIDGSPEVHVIFTSYNDNGREVVLARSFPGHPFESFWWKVRVVVSWITEHITPSPGTVDQRARIRSRAVVRTGFEQWFFGAAATLVASGCAQNGEAVGSELILNYTTIGVRHILGDRRRLTFWMAPDLGCFALKVTTEEQRPDGAYRLVTEKRAIKVVLNR